MLLKRRPLVAQKKEEEEMTFQLKLSVRVLNGLEEQEEVVLEEEEIPACSG